MTDQPPAQAPAQAPKSSPKDVFLHLFAIGALYFCAGSIIALAFYYIEAAFPDPLEYSYRPESRIRWSLALLTVVFPAYLWVSRFLFKDRAASPEKNELRVRKWLAYLTLFLAALLIIGDLVALLYNFLEGELTSRFLLKVLAVFAVALTVFSYYLYDLRRGAQPFSPRARWGIRAATVAVCIVIVFGFISAGSPFTQRLIRFDDRRVSDLSELQSRIVNYWRQKGMLPTSLDDLKDSISGFTPPADPETKVPYGYRRTGELSFELCAVFNLPMEGGSERAPVYYGGLSGNWEHGSGMTCFSRAIDPELYGLPEKPMSLP